MFKLRPSNRAKTARKQERDSYDHVKANRHTPQKLVLTNIVEEESTAGDEPRTFEEDEQYLNECLKALNVSPEDVVLQDSEVEEYDFDDFNSVASTASLLNIPAELAREDPSGNAFPAPSTRQRSLPQTNGHNQKQALHNGANTGQQGNQLFAKERASQIQASISKVQNWNKFGVTAGSDELYQSFLWASESGDLQTLEDLYRVLGGTKDLIIRISDESGNTALHKCAQEGQLVCLKWLVLTVTAGDAVSVCNHDDLTPAAVAAKYGQVECLRWLLERSPARRELQDSETRMNLIRQAAMAGRVSCLRYMLPYMRSQGLLLDFSESCGGNPAHVAAREGHLTCLQALVEHNIDVTSKNDEGRTPADYAYEAGQTGCAGYLIMVESCRVLSARVAKLHQELRESKDENAHLKNRLEFLESHNNLDLPNRREGDGGDQSDSSSTSTQRSSDSSVITRPSIKRRPNGSPDGESPKQLNGERNGYDFHPTKLDAAVDRMSYPQTPSGNALFYSASKVERNTHFQAPKYSDQSTHQDDGSSCRHGPPAGGKHQAMAEQIATVTHKLVLSKHAHKVDGTSPKVREEAEESVVTRPQYRDWRAVHDSRNAKSNLEPRHYLESGSQDDLRDASIKFYDTIQQTHRTKAQVSSSEQSPLVRTGLRAQTGTEGGTQSSSNTRPQAQARKDSTERNVPGNSYPEARSPQGTGHKKKRTVTLDTPKVNKARLGSPSSVHTLVDRRKPSLSSDSPFSSDSDPEHGGQRSGVSRSRRYHAPARKEDEPAHRPTLMSTNRTSKMESWTGALTKSTDSSANFKDNASLHRRAGAGYRPEGRRAQVFWSPRDEAMTTHRTSLVNARATVDDVDPVLPRGHQQNGNEHLWANATNGALTFDEEDSGEKPWYETDDFD